MSNMSAAIITIDHTSPAFEKALNRFNAFQAKMPTAQLVRWQKVSATGGQVYLVASESNIFEDHIVQVHQDGTYSCFCKWGTQKGTPKGYCLHIAGVWQVVQQEINEADQARLEAIAEKAALAEYEEKLALGRDLVRNTVACGHIIFEPGCPDCFDRVEAIWQAAQPEEVPAQAPGYQVTYYGGTTWVNAFEQYDPELFTLDQAAGLIATDQPSEIWLHQVATGLTFHLLAVGEGLYGDPGAVQAGLTNWIKPAGLFLDWVGQHAIASFNDFQHQADLVAAARSDLFG